MTKFSPNKSFFEFVDEIMNPKTNELRLIKGAAILISKCIEVILQNKISLEISRFIITALITIGAISYHFGLLTEIDRMNQQNFSTTEKIHKIKDPKSRELKEMTKEEIDKNYQKVKKVFKDRMLVLVLVFIIYKLMRASKHINNLFSLQAFLMTLGLFVGDYLMFRNKRSRDLRFGDGDHLRNCLIKSLILSIYYFIPLWGFFWIAGIVFR